MLEIPQKRKRLLKKIIKNKILLVSATRTASHKFFYEKILLSTEDLWNHVQLSGRQPLGGRESKHLLGGLAKTYEKIVSHQQTFIIIFFRTVVPLSSCNSTVCQAGASHIFDLVGQRRGVGQ
jgi:hypothetical protein